MESLFDLSDIISISIQNVHTNSHGVSTELSSLPDTFLSLHVSNTSIVEDTLPTEKFSTSLLGNTLLPKLIAPSTNPFFVSQIESHSLNPWWKSLNIMSLPHQSRPGSLPPTAFTLCLWELMSPPTTLCTVSSFENLPKKLLLNLEINIPDLCFFSSPHGSIPTPLPTNFLIIELNSGLYILPHSLDPLLKIRKDADFEVSSDNEEEMRTKARELPSPEDFISCLKSQKKIIDLQEKNMALVGSINTSLDQYNPLLEKLDQRNRLTDGIIQLKKKLAAARRSNKILSEKVEAEKHSLDGRAEAIRVSLHSFPQLKRDLQASCDYCDEKSASLVEKHTQSHKMKMALIADLSGIFKIKKTFMKKYKEVYTINDFPIPNKIFFDEMNEEKLSTAFGYVTHAVYLISNILEIPLRYPVFPRCSRSIISSLVLSENKEISNYFPLFSQNVDHNLFQYAVFLLNKDIEQVLLILGEKVTDLRAMLKNLNKIFTVTKEDYV